MIDASLYLIPVMGAVFVFELAVKPDMLRALLNLNYRFFFESGGADFDSGVMLTAGGNVYAASTAGICAIIAVFEGRRKLAGLAFFLAFLTGSRALFIAFALVAILAIVRRSMPSARKFLVNAYIAGTIVQPFIYYYVPQMLPLKWQVVLYSMSPRYVAWIVYSRMGFDNLFGVGYFQGKFAEEYFFARWPIPAHNQTMVVFGEMGFLGYILWSWFLISMGKYARASNYAASMFVFSLTMYAFIGGFNEWSLWVPLALCVALHPSHQVLCNVKWFPKIWVKPRESRKGHAVA
ncbi:O-antigen ligase family protein [Salipiger pacificus]|nr:O-antigen ligase family protein [Alloyangia pacifica]MCA0948007.1 O-antigen ligase family protein [Alloyangia pacifica]